jgi:hypothetical protein
MLGRLVILAGVLLAATSVVARRVGAGEYVGLDHPVGELRLRLESGGRFVLQLAVWDPVVGATVGQRELSGTWRRTWRGLQLRTPARVITYSGSPKREGWIWERSSLPTFADGIRLAPVGPAPARA